MAAARENLRQVREQCSTEMWEQLNRLYLQVNSTTASEAWLLHSHVFFRAVQEGAHLFQGVTDSTMSHGEGWQYIQLGRFVERTDALARLIGTHFGRLPASARSGGGERRISGVGGIAEILRGLRGVLQNVHGGNPAAARGRVSAAESRLPAFGAVSRSTACTPPWSPSENLPNARPSSPSRLAGRLRATLSFSQIDEIMASGANGYVDSVRWQCAQAHTAIQQVYFDYAVESALVS